MDSPFAAIGAIEADARREAQRNVLRRVFACAHEEACDLILIAGDLFDSKYVTPETERLVLRLLRESPCPVVIAPGNHDPYVEGSFYRRADLPEQVYVFTSSELQCFCFEELKTKVWGYAFTSAALQESPLNGVTPDGEEGYTQLLCAHADLASPLSRYAPLTVGDISRFGIDYAALGHIHQPPKPQTEGKTEIRYSGFAEGRSFDEQGEGGVWLVTIEPDTPIRVERRRTSEQRYEEAELDVSDCADLHELSQKLIACVASYATVMGTHLRLTLVGSAEEEMMTSLLSDGEQYRGDLASLILRNVTVPCPDGATLERDVTLRGALYRALYVSLIHEDPQERRRARRALRIGLAAIEGRSIPEEDEA